MENQTRNANIPERSTAKVTGVSELKTKTESDTTPFRPRAMLLLDIVPAQGLKAADKKQVGAVVESPEGSMQQLLINTEASARRTQSAKVKWQLASLVLGMLLAATAVVIGWFYFEMNSTRTQRGRLAMENQSLKEQLNTAGAQITGFKGEMEALLTRNLELVGENSHLKSQKQPATVTMSATAAKAEQKSVAVKAVPAAGKTPDASRIEAMKKGTFPKGATKEELTAVLGEPDRIYKSRGYEQYVYFGKNPARFWFFGNSLVQTSE